MDNTLKIVKEYDGKYQIIKEEGIKYYINNSKKKNYFIYWCSYFFVIIYCLSNYIWSVDIETGENIAPFKLEKGLFLKKKKK